MRNTRMHNLQRVQIREGIITEPSPNLSCRARYEIGMASRKKKKKRIANTRSCMWPFSGVTLVHPFCTPGTLHLCAFRDGVLNGSAAANVHVCVCVYMHVILCVCVVYAKIIARRWYLDQLNDREIQILFRSCNEEKKQR